MMSSGLGGEGPWTTAPGAAEDSPFQLERGEIVEELLPNGPSSTHIRGGLRGDEKKEDLGEAIPRSSITGVVGNDETGGGGDHDNRRSGTDSERTRATQKMPGANGSVARKRKRKRIEIENSDKGTAQPDKTYHVVEEGNDAVTPAPEATTSTVVSRDTPLDTTSTEEMQQQQAPKTPEEKDDGDSSFEVVTGSGTTKIPGTATDEEEEQLNEGHPLVPNAKTEARDDVVVRTESPMRKKKKYKASKSKSKGNAIDDLFRGIL
ncbi:MAG: hypothetical protein M1823_000394 [Watsoniomyces obsoletus]|nr:MAG: hypothetical protein M1823_000394 [Watsoniomyces obsoletus]